MIQMCPTILLSRRILKTSTNAEKNKCFYFILFYKEKTQTFQVYNSSIKGKKLTLLKCSGCATNSVLYCDFVLKTIHLNPFKTKKFGWIDSLLTIDGKLRICAVARAR